MFVAAMLLVSAAAAQAASTLRLVDPANPMVYNYSFPPAIDRVVHPGDTFALELWIKIDGDTGVSAFESWFHYDTTALQLCNSSGVPVTSLTPYSATFGDTIRNNASNDTILYAAMTNADSVINVDTRVATLYFKVIYSDTTYGDTLTVDFLFDQADSRVTRIGSWQGIDVLTQVDTGAVYVRKYWTWIIYLDGDNNLEAQGIGDFLEMATVGSGDSMNILVQFDRAVGEDASNGDWTICHRYYVTNGMTPIEANAIADWGDGPGREVNMGDSLTLRNFINWSLANYPSDSYILVMWNHGGGWRAPSRPADKPTQYKAICWDDGNGEDCLYMPEMRQAMEATGRIIDIVDMDLCLGGMYEAGYELKNVCRYYVGSEELTPGAGNPYMTILGAMAADPDTNSAGFAATIARLFVEEYTPGDNVTQAAWDMSKFDQLTTELSDLSSSMLTDWSNMQTQRAACFGFGLDAGTYAGSEPYNDATATYIDLWQFADLLEASSPAPISTNATDLKTAIGNTILFAGNSNIPDGHGISIYFPPNDQTFSYYTPLYGQVMRSSLNSTYDEMLVRWMTYIAGRGPTPAAISVPGATDTDGSYRVAWSGDTDADGIASWQLDEFPKALVLLADNAENGSALWNLNGGFTLSGLAKNSGNFSYWSGAGDSLVSTMTLAAPLTCPAGKPKVMVRLWSNFIYEYGYDSAMLQGSADGATWTKLNWFEGVSDSGPWVWADASAFAGGALHLRIMASSDNMLYYDGGYFDDIMVFASDTMVTSAALATPYADLTGRGNGSHLYRVRGKDTLGNATDWSSSDSVNVGLTITDVDTRANIPAGTMRQGDVNVPVLSLTVAGQATGDSLAQFAIANAGTLGSGGIAAVKVWLDSGTPNGWDASDIWLATLAWNAGLAQWDTTTSSSATWWTATAALLVTVNVDAAATVGETFVARVPAQSVRTILMPDSGPLATLANAYAKTVIADTNLLVEKAVDIADGSAAAGDANVTVLALSISGKSTGDSLNYFSVVNANTATPDSFTVKLWRDTGTLAGAWDAGDALMATLTLIGDTWVATNIPYAFTAPAAMVVTINVDPAAAVGGIFWARIPALGVGSVQLTTDSGPDSAVTNANDIIIATAPGLPTATVASFALAGSVVAPPLPTVGVAYPISWVEARDTVNLRVASFVSSVSLTCTPGSVTPAATANFDSGLLTGLSCTFTERGNVTLTVTAGGAAPTDLFISEYIEGTSGSNKAVEIYNGTENAVNLADYQLWKIVNGTALSTWPGTTQALAGTLNPGDVYTVAATSFIGVANLENGFPTWNGNDAVGLGHNIGGTWTLIDAVGDSGLAPAAGWWPVAGTADATKDHTLVRKPTVTSGDTSWPRSAGTDAANSQWIVYNDSDLTHFGSHTMASSGGETGTLNLTLYPAATAGTAAFTLQGGGATETFAAGDTLYIRLTDDNRNLDRLRHDTVTVRVYTANGDAEWVELREGNSAAVTDSAVFYGVIGSARAIIAANGRLDVALGEMVTVACTDALYPSDIPIDTAIISGKTAAVLRVTDSFGVAVTGYLLGDTLYFELTDIDEDSRPAAIDTVIVMVYSTLANDAETVVLYGAANLADTFWGAIPSVIGAGVAYDGKLQALAAGDTLYVTYVDDDDAADTETAWRRLVADGAARVTMTDSAGAEKDTYSISDTIYVRVVDRDENMSLTATETMTVFITAQNGESVTVTLTEINASADTFFGQVLTQYYGTDTLCVKFQPAHGDSLSAWYVDNDSAADNTYDTARMALASASSLEFRDSSYGHERWFFVAGDSVYIYLRDADEAGWSATQTVLLTTTRGDTRLVTLTASHAGSETFVAAVPTQRILAGNPTPGDTIMQVYAGDDIDVFYTDPTDPADSAQDWFEAAVASETVTVTDTYHPVVLTGMRLGDTFAVLIVDHGLNGDSDAINSFPILIWNSARTDTVNPNADETGLDSGIFRVEIYTSDAAPAANAVLEALAAGDTIYILFTDAVDTSDTRLLQVYAVGDTDAQLRFNSAGGAPVAQYLVGNTLYPRVRDWDNNLNPSSMAETVTVRLTSLLTGDSVTLTLNEGDSNSGIFTAGVASQFGAGPVLDGMLQVAADDTVTMWYVDAYDLADSRMAQVAMLLQGDSHNVKINEVVGQSSYGDEWVEIYNSDPVSSIALDSWVLTNYSGSRYSFPAVNVPAHCYVVVHFTAAGVGANETDFGDSVAHFYTRGAPALNYLDTANADVLGLYSSQTQDSTTIIDFVAWGVAGIYQPSADSDAVGAGVWANDSWVAIAGAMPDRELYRGVDGSDSNTAADWLLAPLSGFASEGGTNNGNAVRPVNTVITFMQSNFTDTLGTDYVAGDSLYLRAIADADSTAVVDFVAAVIYNGVEAESVTVALRETGNNSLTYTAAVQMVAAAGGTSSPYDRLRYATDTCFRITVLDPVTGAPEELVMVATRARLLHAGSTAAASDTLTGVVLGDTFWFALLDYDENRDWFAPDTITVQVTNAALDDTETFNLVETDSNSCLFIGAISTDTGIAGVNGVVNGVAAGDTLRFYYADGNDLSDTHALSLAAVGRGWARLDFTDSDGDTVAYYRNGDTVYVRLVDRDINLDRSTAQTMSVWVESDFGDSELVTLTEAGVSAETFTGSVRLLFAPLNIGNGMVEQPVGGNIFVRYTDSNDTVDTALATALVANSPVIALAANLTGADSAIIYAGYPEVVVSRYSDADTVADIDTIYLRVWWENDSYSVVFSANRGADTVTPDSAAKLRVTPSCTQSFDSNTLTCTWTFRYGWQFVDTTTIAYSVAARDVLGSYTGWSSTSRFARYENDLQFTGTLVAAGRNGAVPEDTWVRMGDTLNFSGLTICYEGSAVVPVDTGVTFQLEDLTTINNPLPNPLNSTLPIWGGLFSRQDDTVTVSGGSGSLGAGVTDVTLAGAPDTFIVWVDADSPMTFSSFSAGTRASNSIQLNWSATDDTQSGFAEYRIYYAAGAPATLASDSWGPGQAAALADSNTVTTTVTGLAAGTTYYFMLTATDRVGNIRVHGTQVDTSTAGALDHFDVSGPTTATENVPYTITTILARDTSGLQVSSFVSSVSLTCTPGSVTPATSSAFTAGLLNNQVCTFSQRGDVVLTASAGAGAVSTLAAGDIAIIGFNFDNNDEFGFVALTDIAGAAQIKFTDNGWLAAAAWRAGEGVATWTAPGGGIAKGTVVIIDVSAFTANVGAVAAASWPNFSSTGDQICAYQGTDSHVYALNSEGAGIWQADATSANTSALPTGLINGSTAIALNEVDNAYYSGPTVTGSRAELLAAISNTANWTVDDLTRIASTNWKGAFTVNSAAASGTIAVTVLPAPTAAALNCVTAATAAGTVIDTHIAGDTLYIRLADDDANLYRSRVDSVTVGLLTTRGDSELLTLYEGSADTMYFYGSIASLLLPSAGTPTVSSGRLEVRPGDTVAFDYQDPQTATDSDVQTDTFELRTTSSLLVANALWSATDGFLLGDSIYIEVTDADKDTQPAAVDAVLVTVHSVLADDTETLVLYALGVQADTFRNSVRTDTLAATLGDGILSGLAAGDTVVITYRDVVYLTDSASAANIRVVGDGRAVARFNDAGGQEKYLYLLTDTLYLTVYDRDENLSPTAAETVTVLVVAQSGETATVILRENGTNSDTFFGQVLTVTGGPDTGNLVFQPSLGDTMTLYYTDNDSAGDAVTDTARIDNITASSITFTDSAQNAVAGYVLGDTLYVRLADPDENSNPAVIESVSCTISVGPGSDSHYVVLYELNANSGTFFGGFLTAAAAANELDSVFQTLLPLDSVYVQYVDKDTTTGDSSTDAARLIQPQASAMRFANSAWTTVSSYRAGDTIYVELVDADRNLDISAVESVIVTISTGRGDSNLVLLAEINASADTFRGQFLSANSVAPAGNDSMVQGIGGDSIGARYSGLYGDSAAANAMFDSPAGIAILGLNQTTVYGYYPGDTLYVRVTDPDANLDAAVLDTVYVRLVTTVKGDSELVTLVESAVNSGLFLGDIRVETAAAGTAPTINGIIEDTITLDTFVAYYTDVDYTADSANASHNSLTWIRDIQGGWEGSGWPSIGGTVRVMGTVTSDTTAGDTEDVRLAYIQDSTGFGITLFRNVRLVGPLMRGDVLLVQARISQFLNLTELTLGSLQNVGILPVPAPLVITPAQYAYPADQTNCEQNEGRLLRLNNVMVESFLSNPKPVVTDGVADALLMYNAAFSLENWYLETGDTVSFTGVGYQANADYSIRPHTLRDIERMMVDRYYAADTQYITPGDTGTVLAVRIKGALVQDTLTAFAVQNLGGLTAAKLIRVALWADTDNVFTGRFTGGETFVANLTYNAGSGAWENLACTFPLQILTNCFVVTAQMETTALDGDSFAARIAVNGVSTQLSGSGPADTLVMANALYADGPPVITGLTLTSDSPAFIFPASLSLDSTTVEDTVWFNGNFSQNDTFAVLWSDVRKDSPAHVQGSFNFAVQPVSYDSTSWTLAYPNVTGNSDTIIVITVYDMINNVDSVTINFRSDTTPPTMPVPANPATGTDTRDTFVIFTWSAALDTQSGLARYRFELDTNAALAGYEYGANVYATAHTVFGLADTRYTWRVTAIDSVANSVTTGTRTLTVDHAAPVISLARPDSGSLTNDSYIQVYAWFSDTLAGIDTPQVTVAMDTGAGAIFISGQCLVTDTGFWYSPPAGHADSRDFGCTLALVVADNAGNTTALAWWFTVDRNPPYLQTVTLQSDSSSGLFSPDGVIAPAGQDTVWFNGNGGQTCTFVLVWSDAHQDSPARVTGSQAFGSAPQDTTGADSWTLRYSVGGNSDTVVLITLYDGAGNTDTAAVTVNFRSDTTPPVVPVPLAPADGYDTRARSMLLSWSPSADTQSGLRTYRVEIDSNTVLAGYQFSSDTTDTAIWLYGLADTNYTWRVTAFDSVGHTAVSGTRSFTVDNDTPVISGVLPDSGTTTSDSRTTISALFTDPRSLSGIDSGTATMTINIDSDGVANADTVVTLLSGFTDTGIWYISGAGLDDAETFTVTCTVTVTDRAGNVATYSWWFMVDQTMPDTPAITFPPQYHDTNAAIITVSGTTAEGGDTIYLYLDGSQACSVALGGATTWSCSVTINSYNGTHTLAAVAENNLGRSDTTALRFINFDTLPPVLTVTRPAASPYDTGYNVLYTAGTVTDNSDTPVAVWCGTGYDTKGFAVNAVTGDWGGTISLAVTDTLTLRYWATDSATNTCTAVRVVFLDTAPPAVTAETPAVTDTNAAVIFLRGTASDTRVVLTQVSYSTDTGGSGTLAVAGGLWSGLVTLGVTSMAGTVTVSVTAVDTAGNRDTATVRVYFDPDSPVLGITSPVNNIDTNAAMVWVAGTVADTRVMPPYVTATTIYGSRQLPVVAGVFSGTVPMPYAGVITCTFTAADSATNIGRVLLTVNRDTSAPVVNIDTPAANTDTGTATVLVRGRVSDDNDTPPFLYFTFGTGMDSGGITVNADSTWSRLVTLNRSGTVTMAVGATDSAGNTDTATRTIYYDTMAPTVTLAAPAALYDTNSTAVWVAGTVTDYRRVPGSVSCTTPLGGTVNLGVTGTAFGGLVATGMAGSGTVTITVKATDSAGWDSFATVTVNIDRDSPVITLSFPTGGYDTNADRVCVRGTVSDTFDTPVRLFYTATGGVAGWITVNPATWSFDTYVPLVTTGNCTISIGGTDSATNTGTATVTINRDLGTPVVTILTPDTAADTGVPLVLFTGRVSDNSDTPPFLYFTCGTGLDSGSITVNADSTWSRLVTLNRSGTVTMAVGATDSAGNTDTATRTIYYDSMAPTVTLAAPAALYDTNSTSVWVAGTVTDYRRVPGSVSCTTPLGGTVNLGVTGTAFGGLVATGMAGSGTVTITVKATDSAGWDSFATVTVNIDRDSPVITLSFPTGGYDTNADRVCVRGTVSDTFDTPVRLFYTVTGGVAGWITVNPATWSFDTYVPLVTAGNCVISIGGTDSATNTGTTTVTVNRDLTAPAVTIVTPDTGADTGVPAVLFTGRVSDNSDTPAFLSFTCGTGLDSGSITVNADSTWSRLVTLQRSGTTTVTVGTTDSAGNTDSTTRTIYYDSMAPTVTLAAPAALYDTNSTAVWVAGTVTDYRRVPGSVSCTTPLGGTVNLGVTGTAFGGLVATGMAGSGTVTITVKATDSAGWDSFATVTVNIDRDSPVITLSFPTGGYDTNADRVCVRGTVSDTFDTPVRLFYTVTGGVAGWITVNPGTWSFDTYVPLVTTGNCTISIGGTDSATNTGTTTVTVNRDLTAPAVVIVRPVGSYDTNVAELLVSGTASDSSDTPVYVLAQATGGPVVMLPVVGGVWSGTVPLVPGETQTLTVTGTDSAGNTGTDTRTINYDTMPPLLNIARPADGYDTAAAYVLIGGTAADSIALLDTVYVRTTGWIGSAAVVNGAWSCSVPLRTPVNVITATCTDAATNAVSDTLTVDYDTVAPAITLTAPANNYCTTAQTVTVRGTAADSSVPAVNYVVILVNNVAVASGPVAGGAFSVAALLQPGACSVSAGCSDAFGLAAYDTITVTVDTGVPLVTITNFVSGSDTNVSAGVPIAVAAADSYSAIAGVAVSVNGSGTTAAVLAGGAWSAALNLATGVNTIVATCSDALGNETRAVATLIYDTGAPVIDGVAVTFSPDSVWYAAPLDTMALDTIYVSPGAGMTGTFTVSFTEPSPLAVTGSTNFGQSPADTQAAGGWLVSYVIPGGFTGETTVIITVTDAAGKTDTVTYRFAADSYCPAVTLVTPADLSGTSTVYPLLAWTAVTDTQAGLAYYRVDLDTDYVWTTKFRSDTMLTTSCTPAVALTPGTWVWRVVAVDRAGNVSTAAQRSFRVNPTTDFIAPQDLTPYLEAQGGGLYRVRVEWGASPDTRVTRYHLFYEIDTDASDTLVHAAVADTFISAPATLWRSPFILVSDTRYVFALRAGDTVSEEKNIDVQASVHVPKLTAPANDTGTSVILSPGSGQSVQGSAITVNADLVGIDLMAVASVAFQYRPLGGGVWLDVPTPAGADMTNPDRLQPFYVLWDADGLAAGPYQVRTLVNYLDGRTDEHPVYKLVTLGDTLDLDIRENDTTVAGRPAHVKEQRVYGADTTTVYFGDREDNHIIMLTVPPNAVTDSTYMRITDYVDPELAFADSLTVGEFGSIGEFVTLTMRNGDTTFAGSEIELWFPYMDANNDGIVDDSLMFENGLKLYRYNDATRRWELVARQEQNMEENFIHAWLPSFSTYALFGPAAAANLDLVTVFPNPFRPNDNDPNNGVPFQAGVANTGIIFGNVSARVTIEIFDISGRRVAKLQPENLVNTVQWDGCDEDNSEVASGVYIYVIADQQGNRRTGKMAIIR